MCDEKDLVVVEYTSGKRAGNIGRWKLKRCVLRKGTEPVPTTTEIRNERMQILNDLKNHKQLYESKLPVYEEKFNNFTAAQQRWRDLYLGRFDTTKPFFDKRSFANDVLRGAKAHQMFTDESRRTKHNDKLDALAYIAIDWAKDSKPKPEKENNMKAEIKTLYTNGVLAQTLINDVDVINLSSGNLLNHIGDAESAIKKLHVYPGHSLFIKQEVSRLEKFVRDMYKLLDSLHAKAED